MNFISYLCSKLWERGRLRPPLMRARTPVLPGKNNLKL